MKKNHTAGETYHILYLEEEEQKDHRIAEFKEKAKDFHVEVQIITRPDYDNKLGVLKQKKWDAVMCDIELWDNADDGVPELTCLGFNYIEWLCKTMHYDFIYIILSNVTTRLYQQIQKEISNISLAKQKDDVLKSSVSIENFITEIKEMIDKKRNDKQPKIGRGRQSKKDGGYQKYFKDYIGFLRNENNYPVPAKKQILNNHQEVENYIVEQYLSLKEFFDKKYASNHEIERFFMEYEIKAVGAVGEYNKSPYDQGPTYKDKANTAAFIGKLIARRLLIYIILEYNITNDKLCAIYSAPEYKQHLSSFLYFPSYLQKSSIWDEISQTVPDNFHHFLSQEEITFIEKYQNQGK